MPQLDIPMFVDQIFFISIIFYLGHIYTNEVILPNISALKQYRQLKLNSLKKKSELFAFFILNSNKNHRSILQFIILNSYAEVLNFKYLTMYLASFNYKFFRNFLKENAGLNNLLTKNLIKKSTN